MAKTVYRLLIGGQAYAVRLSGPRRVFSDRDAPFFRFAEPVELSTLTNAFVTHQVKTFEAVSKRKFDATVTARVFGRYEHNQLFFQKGFIII